MKKKRIIILLALIVVVFTGCTNSADPKEVTTAFVNNVIYAKDKENGEKYFYDLDVPNQKELVDDFSELFGLTKKQAKELAEIYQEKLDQETSFSVKMKNDTTKKYEAMITVTGLDQSKFDQIVDKKADEELVVWLQSKGYDTIKSLDDIDKLTDEKQLNDLLNELSKLKDKDLDRIQFEALKKTFKELKAGSKPKTIHIELEQDKKEKKYWKIIDEEKRFDELLEAFQG
jgi:PBP1b-binding outer membrane lipoprotein LpoB